MHYSSLLLLPLLSSTLLAVPVYIGTSTGEHTLSKGIYLADFDMTTGKLSDLELATPYKSPGFLVQHPTLPVLYTCGAPAKPFSDGSGSVAAFNISKRYSLTFMDEANTGGNGPSHIAVDATGNTIAVANYGDGSISTIMLSKTGSPIGTTSLVFNEGTGPNKERQNGPHAHGVYFDKANKHLFVPDLGLDKVLIYPFDAATSKLGEQLPPLLTAPGAGPRHMTFSADEKFAYVINELDSTLLTASHAAGDGKLTMLSADSTLPADFTGKNNTAEVEIHPNGNFIYASNRGHESIVVFKRDSETGLLTFLQHAPCGGQHPRHFKIDPSGKWLLCGNQDSHSITILALDPATGLLGPPSNSIVCPSPSCILFAR